VAEIGGLRHDLLSRVSHNELEDTLSKYVSKDNFESMEEFMENLDLSNNKKLKEFIENVVREMDAYDE